MHARSSQSRSPFPPACLLPSPLRQIPRFAYDREFGVLVRRKATEPVDGAPLVAGLATLLKQVRKRRRGRERSSAS